MDSVDAQPIPMAAQQTSSRSNTGRQEFLSSRGRPVSSDSRRNEIRRSRYLGGKLVLQASDRLKGLHTNKRPQTHAHTHARTFFLAGDHTGFTRLLKAAGKANPKLQKLSCRDSNLDESAVIENAAHILSTKIPNKSMVVAALSANVSATAFSEMSRLGERSRSALTYCKL